MHVMLEDEAKLVLRDLTDEGGRAAHRRDPGHGIGRRSARHFARNAHRRIELVGLAGRQQLHRTLGQIVSADEVVIAVGNDVDDGITHGNDIGVGSAMSWSRSP
jgi:hypothetical protein